MARRRRRADGVCPVSIRIERLKWLWSAKSRVQWRGVRCRALHRRGGRGLLACVTGCDGGRCVRDRMENAAEVGGDAERARQVREGTSGSAASVSRAPSASMRRARAVAGGPAATRRGSSCSSAHAASSIAPSNRSSGSEPSASARRLRCSTSTCRVVGSMPAVSPTRTTPGLTRPPSRGHLISQTAFSHRASLEQPGTTASARAPRD
jgi:hypothetical protein